MKKAKRLVITALYMSTFVSPNCLAMNGIEETKLFDCFSFYINSQNSKISISSEEDRKKYGSGCELLSMVNLLKAYGFKITVDDFFNKYFIYQSWSESDRQRPDPDYCYPGDPRQESGYGCGYGIFSKGLASCLKLYLNSTAESSKYEIITGSDVDTETLVKNYVNKGYPVFIWCTQPIDGIDLLVNPDKPVELKVSGGSGNSWIIHHDDKVINVYEKLDDKDALTSMKENESKRYTWTRGEHCALLVGYNNNAYIINDPFRGKIYVDKNSLNESRKIFNNQIVCMKPID